MMTYEKMVQESEKNLFIIGEIGVNHNGSIGLAKELVDVAVESGCNAVKFQTWITDKVYSKSKSIKPDYQIKNTHSTDSEYELIKKLELSFNDFRIIKEYCDKKNILFFSTPDEIDSAKFLVELGVPLFKTASQDVTNIPFLRQISSFKLPTIFSTGACNLSELMMGVAAISQNNSEIIILHCVSSYPVPAEQMNINFIPTLKNLFNFPVGLSDHSTGIGVACAAVAKGATFFEKHFTMDRNMVGPDHKASLMPNELKEYVTTLREVKSSLGDGIKRIMPCEKNTRKAFERFVVTANDLKKGEIITEHNICFKKTLTGLPLNLYDYIIGAKLKFDLPEETPIELNMLNFEKK